VIFNIDIYTIIQVNWYRKQYAIQCLSK